MKNITKMNIFNIFHDGDFISLNRDNQDVVFQIEIQYLAELIKVTYTYFTGILKNCVTCQFKRWEDTETVFEEIKVIDALIKDMQILSTSLDGELIIVNCQGMEKENRGGDFIFTCDDIELFDQGGLPVTFEALQELSNKAVTGVIEEQKKRM